MVTVVDIVRARHQRAVLIRYIIHANHISQISLKDIPCWDPCFLHFEMLGRKPFMITCNKSPIQSEKGGTPTLTKIYKKKKKPLKYHILKRVAPIFRPLSANLCYLSNAILISPRQTPQTQYAFYNFLKTLRRINVYKE